MPPHDQPDDDGWYTPEERINKALIAAGAAVAGFWIVLAGLVWWGWE